MFALDLHLDGRLGPAAVFVRLVPREGASPHGVWRMRYLACPADTTLAQVKRAIAAGLGEQWAAGHAARAAITSEGIFLDAASELDAKADFSLLYGDPEGLGGMGEPFLRDELTLRMLCLLLANCGEDLKLEYLVTV